jgi:hypothetical protein
MEPARLVFMLTALILITYTLYLTSISNLAERHYPSHLPPSCALPPICKGRASLLSTLAPGAGCTFGWFPAEEVCMILERFGAVVFVGDEVAESVYESFEALLREKKLLWEGNKEEMLAGECGCEERLFSRECLSVATQSISENSGQTKLYHFYSSKCHLVANPHIRN